MRAVVCGSRSSVRADWQCSRNPSTRSKRSTVSAWRAQSLIAEEARGALDKFTIDLTARAADVARCSPAFFPRPKVGADSGKLYATVGADESDEFLRHNQLIRDQWGPTAVPVCETVPGKNHFTILESLANPQGRLHDLALRLVELR